MRQLTRFFALVFTRQTIGFTLLTVAALLVWFLGPALAIDGLRPLASDFVRIACVFLLVALAVFWLMSGPLSLVAVGAGCLLIWHAGPSLSLGASLPLAAAWFRLLLIGVLMFGCALYWLHRLLTAMRTNDDFLANILAFGRNHGAEEPAAERLKDVAATVRRAIEQLRKLRLRGGVFGKIFDNRRYLYELPWYLVLGSSESGKTTALRGAGLQFPLKTVAALQESTRIAGIGGTPHCDWLFANEAVLIDTAGRYATQTGDAAKESSEWRGFLALLRKYRARAPINGAIVALSMSELLQMTASQRAEHAVCLRERLLELRQRLGISFPVYFVVTKTDVLRGFTAYFQSLTSEGRSQPWGFTLKYREGERETAGESLRDEIGTAFGLLEDRLADGLRARMSEEFDSERRRALFALPMEFSEALSALREVLHPMLLDSRFDSTQSSATLRGVYFTSGAQVGAESTGHPFSLVQRLCRMSTSGDSLAAAMVRRHVDSAQGFFLQDVFRKVIFSEAHLVRPNLRWELRFRAMRLLGHLVGIAMFIWLAGALASSFENNRDYLNAVAQRTSQLTEQVRVAFATPAPTPIGSAEVLGNARALTTQVGLDTAHPPIRFTFGLYAAPPVVDAGFNNYADLQTLVLLPSILRRMEHVLALSLKDRDNRSAYETLRVYKLLHDSKRYVEAGGAASVREWVRRDAQVVADAARGNTSVEGADRAGTAIAELAGRASLAVHFDALFAADRLVQAASLADESLIRAVQGFLDDETATQRIYERAKLAMQAESPPDFTLVRAVGPQVGTVFARHEGLPLDKGVPGLFTYDGYHLVFAPRIAAFVRDALLDDDWVMGRGNASSASAALDRAQTLSQWVIHVRKQYLAEYVIHWDAFLASLRTVGFVEDSGGNVGLGFDLSVLRQLATPDSPLSRLARAAVRETTLSQPRTRLAEERGGLLDKAAAVFDQVSTRSTSASSISRISSITPTSPTSLAAVEDADDKQLARDVVDSHFAALREIVTGNADAAESRQEGAGGRPRLEAVIGLINDFYTWMVVADTALSAGGLPPGGGNGGEAGSRLKLEAGRLPAPFKEILAGLATNSGEKVAKGATDIFRRQAQLQLDRLMGLMALQVSEPCKRGVEGRYPFAAVAQDASVEDFTLVFSAGGALDEFFSKYLASFVDTSVRPWRYRNPDGINLFPGSDALNGLSAAMAVPAGVSGPTLLGELLKLLARDGPNLDAFYRAQQIRNVFFRDPGGRKMAWKMEIAVRELEPSITELLIDIDGQGQRYVHGPVQPLTVAWPGPRGGLTAEVTAHPRISSATSTLLMQGPWALFRLLDKGRSVDSATPGRSGVEYVFDGRKALLELGAGSQPNPLNSDLFKGFRCPGRTA